MSLATEDGHINDDYNLNDHINNTPIKKTNNSNHKSPSKPSTQHPTPNSTPSTQQSIQQSTNTTTKNQQSIPQSSSHEHSKRLSIYQVWDYIPYITCSGRFRSELMQTDHSLQRSMRTIVLSFFFLSLYTLLILISRYFFILSHEQTQHGEGEKSQHYILAILVFAVTPLSNFFLGKSHDHRYAPIQPFYGGRRFIFLQAVAWCLYGLGLASLLYVIFFVGLFQSRSLMAFICVTGVLAQTIVVVSITYFQADGKQRSTTVSSSTTTTPPPINRSQSITTTTPTSSSIQDKSTTKISELESDMSTHDEISKSYKRIQQQHDDVDECLVPEDITHNDNDNQHNNIDVKNDSNIKLKPKLLKSMTSRTTAASVPSKPSSTTPSATTTTESSTITTSATTTESSSTTTTMNIPLFQPQPRTATITEPTTITSNKYLQRFYDVIFVGAFFMVPLWGGLFISLPLIAIFLFGLFHPITAAVLTAQTWYYLTFLGDSHLSGDLAKKWMRLSSNPLWQSALRYFDVRVVLYDHEEMMYAREQSIQSLQLIRNIELPQHIIDIFIHADNNTKITTISNNNTPTISPTLSTNDNNKDNKDNNNNNKDIDTNKIALTAVTSSPPPSPSNPETLLSPSIPTTPMQESQSFSTTSSTIDDSTRTSSNDPRSSQQQELDLFQSKTTPTTIHESIINDNEIIIHLDEFMTHESLGINIPYLYYLIGAQKYKYLVELSQTHPEYKPTYDDLTFTHPDLILTNTNVNLHPLPPAELIKYIHKKSHIFVPTISSSFLFAQAPHGIYPLSTFFSHKSNPFEELFGNRLHHYFQQLPQNKYRIRETTDFYGNIQPTFNRYECYTFNYQQSQLQKSLQLQFPQQTISMPITTLLPTITTETITPSIINTNNDNNNNSNIIETIDPTCIAHVEDQFLPKVLKKQKILYPHHANKSSSPTDIDVLGASVLSFTPGLREAFLWNGGCDVSRSSLTLRVTTNRSILLIPGGQREMIWSNANDRNFVFYTKHLGFIKIALRCGLPVVPIISFGENQIFSTLQFPALQLAIYKATRIFLPFFPHGPAMSMWPHSIPITLAIGEPIFLPCIDEDDISNEIVSYYHNIYLTHVARLFFECRDAAGYPNSTLRFA